MISACQAAVADGQGPTAAALTPTEVRTTAVPPSATSLPASPTATSTAIPTATITATPTPVVIAALADVAICGQEGHEDTAALIAEWGVSAILMAGDISNEDGILYQYQRCFEPAWGAYLDRIHPVPGNHDYYSDPLQNYYLYFDGQAGEAGQGWYSFNAGNWHIIALNSNCGAVACGPSSEQVAWLKQDLAENDQQCSIAFWHVPRWNSGPARNAHWMSTFWDILHPAGVEMIINGHDHHYERTGKVDAKGLPDQDGGIREFIVGTGGAGHYYEEEPFPFSEKTIYGQFGVLKLVLGQQDYQWQFINTDGEVLDEGADRCH